MNYFELPNGKLINMDLVAVISFFEECKDEDTGRVTSPFIDFSFSSEHSEMYRCSDMNEFDTLKRRVNSFIWPVA